MVFYSKKKLIFCIFYIFIGFYILGININSSCASNVGRVFLSCDSYEFFKDEEFEVVINLENNKTSAFKSNLYFDDSKVEFISGPDNINLIDNRIVYVWYDVNGGNNAINGELVRFKFRAKNHGRANFVIDGEFYSVQEDLMEIEFKHLYVDIGDSKIVTKQNEELGTDTQIQNANLKSLRLNREGLVPNFQSDIYEYYLTVLNDVNNIDVIAISENPNATIEITGNTNLKEGLNKILINVFSEDKIKNNLYTINVTKTSDIELANTNLEILAIENVLLYPQFDTNVTNYNAEVSNGISNLNILAVPENEKATVKVNGNENLKEGNNLITINVIAPNGVSKRNYNLNIYIRNLEEENKYLEDIEINKDKLEEIYETEKINNYPKKEENKKQVDKKIIIIISVIITCIIIILLLIILKRIKNKNKFI